MAVRAQGSVQHAESDFSVSVMRIFKLFMLEMAVFICSKSLKLTWMSDTEMCQERTDLRIRHTDAFL